MTFLEIQDAVMDNLFDETDRANVKNWINLRYGWMLALEKWTFLNATASVTVTSGSQTVTGLPTNFGVVIGLWDSDGAPLKGYSDWREFLSRYNTNLDDTGTPEAYTVIGGTLLVGPTPDTTATDFLLAHELEAAAMSADADVPVIPSLFHRSLVSAGRAEGMKERLNPAWREVEQNFLASIDAMRRRYLTGVRQTGEQVPAYRP